MSRLLLLLLPLLLLEGISTNKMAHDGLYGVHGTCTVPIGLPVPEDMDAGANDVQLHSGAKTALVGKCAFS